MIMKTLAQCSTPILSPFFYMKAIFQFFLSTLFVLLLQACSSGTSHSHEALNGQQKKTVEQCEKLFHQARQAQSQRQYQQAVELYARCLATDTPDTVVGRHLQPTVVEAMLQMMNCYQAAAMPEECVTAFGKLHRQPTHLLRRFCWRDLLSIEAYALSRTERMGQAERQMEQVLHMSDRQLTHEQLFRDYAYAAAIFYPDPTRQEQVIELCRRCLEEASLCKHTSGVQWVQSMLGNLYVRTGKVNEAIGLYEDCIGRAEAQNDTLGTICAMTDLAEVYLDWNLEDEAEETVDDALSLLRKKDYSPLVAVNTLLLKGRIYQARQCRDSAFYYIEKAQHIAEKLPYNSGSSDCDYQLGNMLIDCAAPDSAEMGFRRLQKVAVHATPQIRARAFYALARYEKRQSRNRECSTMLDSMYAISSRIDSTINIPYANGFALSHYLELNDQRKVAQYANALARKIAKTQKDNVQSRLADNIVKMRTHQKAQDLELEHSKLQLRQTVWSIIILLFFLLMSVWWYFSRQRNKMNRLQRLLLEGRLNAMMDRLEKSEATRSSLQQELEKLQASATATPSQPQETERPLMALPDSEDWFSADNMNPLQERFSALHPHFFERLDSEGMGVTFKEKRLAMLIMLGLTPMQIATMMQVATRTITIYRYRLRQKLNLTKDDSLEEKLKELMA